VAVVEGGCGAVLVAEVPRCFAAAVEVRQVVEAEGDVDGGLGGQAGDGGAADVLDDAGGRAEDRGQAGALGGEGAGPGGAVGRDVYGAEAQGEGRSGGC
jgi:hypothetical protein